MKNALALTGVMALVAAVAVALGGCAKEDLRPGQPVVAAVPFVTKETGRLTIERQEFVDTWASVQVLFDGYVEQNKKLCAQVACRDAVRCALLPDVEAQGKVIKMTVEAKLRNPEATIDWQNVAKILGLIAKMVL